MPIYEYSKKNSSGTELISSMILNSISKTVLNTSLFFLTVSPWLRILNVLKIFFCSSITLYPAEFLIIDQHMTNAFLFPWSNPIQSHSL